MIKCGVCGSENEAQALFCGTCGRPLSPAEAKAIVEETKPVEQVTPTDESVVPGKGGARRDLGTGGETTTKPVTTEVTTAASTEEVGTETSGFPGPSVVCGVCGTVNDASRTYCRKCANELKPAAQPPPPVDPTPKRTGISPTVIGLAAAAVVVVVGVGIILALGGTGPAATSTPGTPSAAAVTTGPTSPGQTTTPSQVAPTAAPVTAAELSGRIAFSRCDGSDCEIVMIELSNPNSAESLTSVSDGSASEPEFTHDGQRIIYSLADGTRIIDVGSRDITRHSSGRGDSGASWSWDDDRITFSGRRDSDPDGPNNDPEVRLDGVTVAGPSEPLTSNRTDDIDPVFTFDDQSIVWAQGRADNIDLKIIDLDSRVIENLMEDDVPDVDPAARPGERTIAFASRRDGSDGFDLFLMDLDSREVTPLLSLPGDQHDPAWSPTGQFIVFTSTGDGSRDLFVLDVSDPTRTPLHLTSTAEDDRSPSWGP